MTAEQLKKDTENRLETIFHIRARFDDLAEHKRLCIIASLLHAYDTSWQVESLPSLIGKSNILNNEEKTSATVPYTKKDVATLKRWMIVMGVGYLTQGSSLGESKKFTHLCTILMDKIEQRHGSKLKPLIRQIIGKQSRLTVKNVVETQRQNQHMDSSGTISNPDCQENPFQGRSIPRSAQENPPAPGRDLPRTPLTKTNHSNGHEQRTNVDKKHDEDSLKQSPTKPKLQDIENSKPECNLVVPPRNIIPSGKKLPRTPLVGEKQMTKTIEDGDNDDKSFKQPSVKPRSHDEENSKSESNLVVPSSNIISSGKELPRTPMVKEKGMTKSKEPGVPCDYEIPTKFGPDDSPITPRVSNQILKNIIPCGENIIPRTPFNGVSVQDKKDSTESSESPKATVQIVKDMKNFIPCGKNIPRTPFLKNDKSIAVEDSTCVELQSVKTFPAEANARVIDEEPTRKLSKLTLHTEEIHKEICTEKEEPTATGNQPSEEKQTSKKSAKAKQTSVRPRSKKKPSENADANSEKSIEESNKTIVIKGKVDDNAQTSKSNQGKIKQNKTVELLSKEEQDIPRRRRSPRLIQSAKGEEKVVNVDKPAAINADKTSSRPKQVPSEESKSSVTRQKKLDLPTKANDSEKDVKLPQIEDKSKAPPKRKGKKKAAKAKMDISFDVIEELVPPLKMAKGKDNGRPNERISDEVYSTPLVKTATKVGMARKQRKTKKSQAQIFSIQDEIFQTPSRRQH